MVSKNLALGAAVEPASAYGFKVRSPKLGERESAGQPDATDIEDVNFLKTMELRRAIHARERGKCFYCLRSITPRL